MDLIPSITNQRTIFSGHMNQQQHMTHQYVGLGECSLVKICFQYWATDTNLEPYLYGNSAWLRDSQDRVKKVKH